MTKQVFGKVNVIYVKTFMPEKTDKQDVVQIAIEPESSPAGLIPDNGNRPMHLDNSHSLSIIVWRYNVSEHGRSGDAVAVCCFVSDRMVFRIDVDTGFDPPFSPDKEDTICAEQSFHSGCLYDLCRNYCLYFTYFYQKRRCYWIDEIANHVFPVFICCSLTLYASDYGGQNCLSEEIS